MKSKYCVLFALGDVLVDTGTQYKEIWKQIGDKYGAETEDLLVVVEDKDTQKILLKYFSHLTQEERDSLINELNERESKMKIREIPGASRFVKELKDQGVKMGLVTGFTQKQVDAISHHLDFIKAIDTVVTVEDVDREKPDPQGFLQAADNLGYKPSDCVVFEDSFSGIEAAKRAGMEVIALSTLNKPQDLRAVVSKVIPDFSNFSVADLHALYQKHEKHHPAKEKKSSVWIYIVLLLLVLLGLFFIWRSCVDSRNKIEPNDLAATSTQVKAVSDETSSNKPNVEVKVQETVAIPLSDGNSVNAFKNGMEDKIIAFLNSDDYKNATDNDLKSKWFDFDNIEFVHGSSSELTEGSYAQLNNLAQILKQYKDVKVKIGGYADKTGSEDVNKKISQDRANTIKSYLVNQGLDSGNIMAEGYSDEFAKHSANAPDSERAEDRKVALRFVK